MSLKLKTKILILFMCLICILTGCFSSESSSVSGETSSGPSSAEAFHSCSRDIFAMDTYMTITCYGVNAEAAADAAEAEIKRLDDLLSVGKADSEISRLNNEGSANISEDSAIMIREALELFEETDGAFDIAVYPVMVLWGFTSHEYHVPTQEELESVLKLVGSDRIVFSGDSVRLENGQGVDLGGIAKGYASDRLSAIFEEYGLVSGLISLGGNVQLYGAKPDGSSWRCGIRDPLDPDSPENVCGVLSAENCAVITSGAYERNFTSEDGISYHHIIDPRTGFPAENGIISSTIVSESGMLADALSTAVYVMGLDNASEFWRSSAHDFDMILMTDDGEIYITEGLDGSFKTSYPLHVIKQ